MCTFNKLMFYFSRSTKMHIKSLSNWHKSLVSVPITVGEGQETECLIAEYYSIPSTRLQHMLSVRRVLADGICYETMVFPTKVSDTNQILCPACTRHQLTYEHTTLQHMYWTPCQSIQPADWPRFTHRVRVIWLSAQGLHLTEKNTSPEKLTTQDGRQFRRSNN